VPKNLKGSFTAEIEYDAGRFEVKTAKTTFELK
jgi:hypothetical protein